MTYQYHNHNGERISRARAIFDLAQGESDDSELLSELKDAERTRNMKPEKLLTEITQLLSVRPGNYEPRQLVIETIRLLQRDGFKVTGPLADDAQLDDEDQA